MTEPEKTVLSRATPVARERAPTGANPDPDRSVRVPPDGEIDFSR
jgi:hypothetical protein